jgi:hypothetical protein
MSESKQAPLEIQLGTGESPLRFNSLDEIATWLSVEQAEFQFLQEAAKVDQTQANNWNRVTQFFASTRSHVDSARRRKTAMIEADADIKQIVLNVQAFYKWSGLASPNPRRVFLLDLAKRSQLAAGYAFSFLIGKDTFSPNRPAAFEGIIQAFLFASGALEPGSKAAADASLKALDEIRVQFSKALEDYRRDAKQAKSAAEEVAEAMHKQVTTQAEEHSNLCKAHGKSFDENIQAAQKQLQDIASAYDAKMALQAPVSYWESQRNKHRNVSIGFAIASAVWAAASVALIYIAAERLLTAAPGEVIQVLGLPIPKVPIWHFGLLAVLLTFAIWVARILVRILLSQVHLYTDASERVVMAMTYISLLREGQGPKDEDRQLILQTLFRPSATGIVKDDAIPPTVLEWITRLGSK